MLNNESRRAPALSILLVLISLPFVASAWAALPPKSLDVVAEVKGMTCGGCAKRLKTVLARVEHVQKVEVDHVNGRVAMVCGQQVEFAALRKSIENAGFSVLSLRRASGAPAPKR